jgi:hypothetical protein
VTHYQTVHGDPLTQREGLSELLATADHPFNVFRGAAKQKEYEKLEKLEAKREFWSEWGKNELAGLKAHGIVIIICGSPGHISVYVDRAVRDQGFTVRDEELVEKMLLEKFKEAKDKQEAERPAIHDQRVVWCLGIRQRCV